MWLSRRNQQEKIREQTAEVGIVTLERGRPAVCLTGERRNLPILTPGGYCWQPAAGDTVLVLKSGADGEQAWVLGVPGGGELLPGEVWIRGIGGGIHLDVNGAVDLRGIVKINGTKIEDMFERKKSGG